MPKRLLTPVLILGFVGATCYAQQEELLTIEIAVSGAQALRGWSVSLRFDPDQVAYVSNSFNPTDFMPGLVPLVRVGTESVEIGGAILGANPVSGSGTVARIQFALSVPIDAVEIVATEYAVSSDDHGARRQSVRSTVPIRASALASDFNLDGTVDFTDFFLFADHFGGTNLRYDIVADGVVDFGDFFLFADSFGNSSEMVGLVTIPADILTEMREVIVVGSIDTGGLGSVDITGTYAPADTVYVEVVGSISE